MTGRGAHTSHHSGPDGYTLKGWHTRLAFGYSWEHRLRGSPPPDGQARLTVLACVYRGYATRRPPAGNLECGYAQGRGCLRDRSPKCPSFSSLETLGAAPLRSVLGWHHFPCTVTPVPGDAVCPMEPHWQRAPEAHAHLPQTSPEAFPPLTCPAPLCCDELSRGS